MKEKVLTLLILQAFCFCQIGYATEAIVGTDKQVMYADEQVSQKNRKDVLVNNNIEAKKLKQINDIQDYNNDFETVTPEKIKELAMPYEKQNMKLIKKEKKKIVSWKFIQNINWGEDDTFYKIPLLGGDYVIWNPIIMDVDILKGKVYQTKKAVQYAREFDKNGELKGDIKIVRVDANTVAFYEYRKDQEFESLTHIVIFYNDEHQATFVYTVDGVLRSCMLDKKLYSVDLPIVPKVQNLELGYSTLQKGDNVNLKNGTVTAAGVAGLVVGGAIYSVAIAPFMVIAHAIMLPCFVIQEVTSGKKN